MGVPGFGKYGFCGFRKIAVDFAVHCSARFQLYTAHISKGFIKNQRVLVRYEQGLVRHPDLAGQLVLEFALSPTGSVVRSGTSDVGFPDALVARCLANVVRRWSFPAPEPAGPVEVRFPLALSLGGGE